MASRFSLAQHRRCHLERLDEILEIRALAADMKAEALDDQPRLKRCNNEVHGFARIATEF